ncbi:MAG TPA: polysaccharide biosynthesis/export family protein [Gallionella sp.]
MHFDRGDAKVERSDDSATVEPILKTITPQLIQQELAALAAGSAQSDLAPLMTTAEPYKIGPGDHLAITVWDHPELVMPVTTMTGATATVASSLPAGYTVSTDGRIQFPYAGDFVVAGLTTQQARDLLVERLAHYIKQPEVTLRVLNFRSQRIYVDGEVKTPGIVSIDDIPLTLPEAINRAGGVTPLGDQSRVSLTRNGKTYWINLPQLTTSGIDPTRIMLTNGDMLRVSPSEESKVFVVGEVNTPKTLTLRNGRLTLNEALGEAGGINPLTATGHQVYVIRNANDAQPVVYHLDARSPVMFAMAENFELKAKDVIYVDAASIVRFNRIISLILPTAQTVQIINRGFK